MNENNQSGQETKGQERNYEALREKYLKERITDKWSNVQFQGSLNYLATTGHLDMRLKNALVDMMIDYAKIVKWDAEESASAQAGKVVSQFCEKCEKEALAFKGQQRGIMYTEMADMLRQISNTIEGRTAAPPCNECGVVGKHDFWCSKNILDNRPTF